MALKITSAQIAAENITKNPQVINLTIDKYTGQHSYKPGYAIRIETGIIGEYVRTLEGHYDRVVTDYQVKTITIDANISVQRLKTVIMDLLQRLG